MSALKIIDYARFKPESCINCPLYKAPGPVWGRGREDAKIGYIGQNPGEVEIERMAPFEGPSGAVLGRQLYEAGIPRDDVFITNQVKCLTPKNRMPSAVEIQHCKPLLEKELAARPKMDTIILSGQVAWSANIGSRSCLAKNYITSGSVMERMGCVEQFHGRKWIGTIHPAFIMRMPDFKQAPVNHLIKAKEIVGMTIPLPEVAWEDLEALAFHKAMAKRIKMFADDVETSETKGFEGEDEYIGGDWEITMCGFSAAPYKAVVVKKQHLHEWADVWADPEILQFEQNGEYDRFYLEKIAPQLNRRHDTMLAYHYLNNNSKRKALKPNVVSAYTYLPYYNRDLGDINEPLYCGMDNIATFLAGRRQLQELAKWGLDHTEYHPGGPFYDIGMPMLPILERWRREGLRVDYRRALLYRRFIEARLAKGTELMQKLVGVGFNWNSPPQRKALLYDRWKLPVQYNVVEDKKTKARKQVATTDYDARVTLKRWIDAGGTARQATYKQALLFFQLDDYVSENEKLLEYFNRISPDMKLHAYWKLHGAQTFRIATKPNVQNWPTWPIAPGHGSLRSIVLADNDDDLLIGIDFSQLQLWIYATIFNIQALLRIFESGEYLYGAVYEQVTGKPFFQPGKPRTKKYKGDWITEEELLRAKAIPLGFLFARSGESIAAEKGWPALEGIKLKNAYMKDKPELTKAHADIMYAMKQKGLLRPPPGMLLHYPMPNLQGYNCFAQTPETMMLQEKIIAIEREIERRKFEARTMLSVHDSLNCNVRHGLADPQRMIDFAENILFPVLRRPVPWLNNFVFPFEAKVGIRWDWETTDYDSWKDAVLRGADKYCAPFAAGQEVIQGR